MSVHQMICHLIDGLRMMTGEKTTSLATGLPQRTIIKWIALYVPVPWPPGVLTRPEIDQEFEGTKPREFAMDIDELETRVNLLATQPRNFDRRTHPIFGRLSERAWLRWAYLHMDHHLRQFGA